MNPLQTRSVSDERQRLISERKGKERMEDGEQLARRGGDATVGRASQEQTELRAEAVARDDTGEAAGARDTAERRQPRSCHGKGARSPSASPPLSVVPL